MVNLDKQVKIAKGLTIGGAVTTVSYEGDDYIYLINEVKQNDVMFCKYQGEEFEKVDNLELVEKLLNLILPEMKQIIAESKEEQ